MLIEHSRMLDHARSLAARVQDRNRFPTVPEEFRPGQAAPAAATGAVDTNKSHPPKRTSFRGNNTESLSNEIRIPGPGA
jgi:hypothetical protein